MIGLLAAPPVAWLLSVESNVKQRVEAFITGQDGPAFDVAGPPDDEELIKLKDNPGPVELPCVHLKLSMTKHNLTGERCVAIDCSEYDLSQIADWQRRAIIRRRLELKRN